MSQSSPLNSISAQKLLALYETRRQSKNIVLSDPGSAQALDVDTLEISPEAKNVQEKNTDDWNKMGVKELLKSCKEIFQKIDLNGDGKVSWREAEAVGLDRASFDRYDVNKDGEVTLRKEFVPSLLHDLRTSGAIDEKHHAMAMKVIEGIGGPFRYLNQIFYRLDSDNNHQVSKEEAQKAGVSEDLFNSYDLNKDGSVDFLSEYLPTEADRFHKMGVFNDREYEYLKNRIENALKHRDGGDPIGEELEPKRRAPVRLENRPEDRPMVRARLESWISLRRPQP